MKLRKTLIIFVLCLGTWSCNKHSGLAEADRDFVKIVSGTAGIVISQTLPLKSRQKAEDAGDIHFSNIFLTLDELKTGAVQRVTYHHYGDRSTAFLQIRITRCEQNPAQPGNLLMDFEFRAPDESIDVQNVSWNQRDFVALARGSDWSASLTAQREELAK